ncbi:uncharacterized protein J3D65DRAFT_558993 [Phyllosticta citribraziliensis]|uniref:Zinc finger C2H2 LYAR-type domain-containing protein n=1 Tax=Phyllosticta citribraziliensis TaxID=989973 RepID=A0ABR1LEI5_9PEZI
MVSFSCEGCGDVLTKKKLDGHRNQCWNASYTCIDCMKHFQGTSYKAHTSCMSEAQKYQGKLYKEKKKGPQPRQNNANNSQALVPTKAPIEEVPAVLDVPPAAPSPPPAVNVFDFLVTDDTPTAPRISTGPTADETRMIEDGQGLTTTNTTTTTQNTPGPSGSEQDRRYEEDGYLYSHAPVRPGLDRFDSWDLEPPPRYGAPYTPANKWDHHRREPQEQTTAKSSKSDKKRKRQHLEDAHAEDTTMVDAPPMLHTGLTGGLNKMLSAPGDGAAFPSPDSSGDAADDSNDAPSPSASSPIKRKKHSSNASSTKEGRKDKDKDAKKSKKSKHHDAAADTTTQRRGREIVRVRRRRASSSSPEHAARKATKAIEYHPQDDAAGAVVKYDKNGASTGNARADLFFGLVTKGPDSERGVSLNKALKRYFKEKEGASSRAEEEKELWKALRLRKNDRGEIVLFADA